VNENQANNYLLDTHVLLWYRLDPDKISARHRRIISGKGSIKFISSLSIWEISLKFGLGKLHLGGHTPEEFMATALAVGFQIASPEPEHFASFHRLPPFPGHKDPFDRILVWQAKQTGLILLSGDSKLSEYSID